MAYPTPSRVVGADTVRALATLWVFAGHLFVVEPALKTLNVPGLPVLMSGYMGVAAFFVLSGFLLSMPFWRAHRAGVGLPCLKTYALRRVARIVPEYFVCVFVLAVISGAFASRWGVIQVAGCLTFTNTLLPGTYMPAWNPPLWSISIEMMFYLMLPLVAVGVFWLRGKVNARVCVLALMAGIAAAQAVLLWAAPSLESAVGEPAFFSAGSSATTKNAVVLFAHFLVGVIAADVYLAGPLRMAVGRFNRYDLLALAAAAVIVGSLAGARTLPGIGYMHYQWPMFPTLIGVLLVSLPRSATVGNVIETRFIRSTAALSYGIYIWHVPILYALKSHWPTTPDGRIGWFPLFAAATLASSYAVAWLSYRFVGKPALDRLKKREDRRQAKEVTAPLPHKAAA